MFHLVSFLLLLLLFLLLSYISPLSLYLRFGGRGHHFLKGGGCCLWKVTFFLCFSFEAKHVLRSLYKGLKTFIFLTLFHSLSREERKSSSRVSCNQCVQKFQRHPSILYCLFQHCLHHEYLFCTPLLCKRGFTLPEDLPFPVWHLLPLPPALFFGFSWFPPFCFGFFSFLVAGILCFCFRACRTPL